MKPYISIPLRLRVCFAKQAGRIDTLEGSVGYEACDAIVTGIEGESWPIAAASFPRRYLPAPGTEAGSDGWYVKRGTIVLARRLQEPIQVPLPAGRGELQGKSGDWLVRYEDGSEAVITAGIFEASYEDAVIPLTFCANPACGNNAIVVAQLEKLAVGLREVLQHTPVRFVDISTVEATEQCWFTVTDASSPKTAPTGIVIDIPLSIVLGGDGAPSLPARVAQAQARFQRSVGVFTGERLRILGGRLRNLWDRISDDDELVNEADDEENTTIADVLAAQLSALDLFNATLLGFDRKPEELVRIVANFSVPVPGESNLLARLRVIGAVADERARRWQICWQRLVLGDTSELAGRDCEFPPGSGAAEWIEPPTLLVVRRGRWRIWRRLFLSASLSCLGLIAAISFAAFTEVTDGCGIDPRDAVFRWMGCADERWRRWSGSVLLALYLASILLAWIRYARAEVMRVKDRHQDCRLLAEALRVQYVLEACGLRARASDAFPSVEHAPSGWVLHALRALEVRYASPMVEKTPSDASHWAREHFVRDQIRYHRRKLIGQRRCALFRFRRWGSVGLLAFIAMVALVTIDHLIGHAGRALLPDFGRHLAVVAMAAGLAGWATMTRVSDLFAWEAEAHRGTLVLNALRQAEQQMADRSGDTDAQAEVVWTAGRVFVSDQAAWHALHRANPIEAASGN